MSIITVDGKVVVTIAQAAAARGITQAAMRKAISMQKIRPAFELDGRTPLFDPAEMGAILDARPGRGSHFRRHSVIDEGP